MTNLNASEVNGKSIGVIDIGSNGIRFGLISSLQRHLPMLYEERAPISLFNAQHDDNNSERIPFSKEVIDDVINCLKRFKYLSSHYKIDDIKVIATEATRTAPNSDEFLSRVYESTGLRIELLPEATEARISAMGVMATYYGVEGLVMDMGGGSMELNFIIHRPNKDGIMEMSDLPVNLPYGAAALTKLMKESKEPRKRENLFNEIKSKLRDGFNKLNPPESIKDEGGYTIYMTGGGFRSLGYLSMSEEMNPKLSNAYPIPIINGYGILAKNLVKVINQFLSYVDDDKPKFPNGYPFRISKRRSKLLPAACFLFKAVMEVIPIGYIYFCEGGVRHGQCFDLMSPYQHLKDPLETFIFTHPLHPTYLNLQYCNYLVDIIKDGIPSALYEILDHDEHSTKKSNRLERLLPNLICLAHWTMNFAKESRPISAFNLPLAGGPLSNAPGLTHTDRAILSWCLMWRYHDDASGAKSGGIEKDMSVMNPVLFESVKKLVPAGNDGRVACEIIGKFIGFVILTHPGPPQFEKISTFVNIPRLFKFNTFEETTDDPNRKRYHVHLTVLSKSEKATNDIRSRTKYAYLVDNSIVKGTSKKLEKSYTLVEEKNRPKRGYHLGEIYIKVKFAKFMDD